ncbi:MAG: hypothetical protein LBU83_03330 [Bacteroidales bacterium]|jgi:hypothetical protein|nr:hypothetical protein [Bacteroidales bacterium]
MQKQTSRRLQNGMKLNKKDNEIQIKAVFHTARNPEIWNTTQTPMTE